MPLNTDDCCIPGPIEENLKSRHDFSFRSFLFIRELKQRRRPRQRERRKSNNIIKKHNYFARASSFFVHFCRHCTTHVKCLIARFLEDVNKRQRIFFLSLNLRAVPANQLLENSPTFDVFSELE